MCWVFCFQGTRCNHSERAGMNVNRHQLTAPALPAATENSERLQPGGQLATAGAQPPHTLTHKHDSSRNNTARTVFCAHVLRFAAVAFTPSTRHETGTNGGTSTMAKITDTGIRSAIRDGKQRRMADGEGRGSGRLVLVIKPKADGVAADWYAQQWAGGKRTTAKIGTYPALSLAQARARYASQYGEPIAQGQNISRARESRVGTLNELITGYVTSLEQRGSPSASDNLQRLRKFAAAVGGDRQARDITTADVLDFLRPTFKRGRASLADHDRSYIRAAFSWGLLSENDYRDTAADRRFHLAINPAAVIPTAAKQVGNRWLSEDEFRRVYRWLGSTAARLTPANSVALRVLMLTGQRVQEIAGLRHTQWISAERLLVWLTTKNGSPHAVPVCDLAAALLDSLPANGEWLFPMDTDPSRPVHHGSLYSLLWRNRESIGVEKFTNRDLRRTWKTLAGKAGLSKWDRDLLQNHARTDVSSTHYDRHDYLTEKRSAVEKWGQWIGMVLQQ